jgi:uncharacterized phosphosugar-binding protein
VKNDLQISHWEREYKKASRALADAIRDEHVWNVIGRVTHAIAMLNELKYRAIAIGFEKHPQPPKEGI